IPMCRGIGYKMTSMPNQFNHQKQEEAGMEVHQFWPLVEVSCSKYLKFFLCSMYVPICLPDYTKPLPPCKSVCEDAKTGCAPLMAKYGFAWPENLDCSKLPIHGDPEKLCMGPDDLKKEGEATTVSPKNKPPIKPYSVDPIFEFPPKLEDDHPCKC